MGFFSRVLSTSRFVTRGPGEVRAGRRGDLVHIFVFDSADAGLADSRRLSSLVRSLIPESLAYPEVPISFFVDANMPASVGQRASHDLEVATRYAFAWMKIKETKSELVEGLKVGNQAFTFSWQEYTREGDHRGILFAFYILREAGVLSSKS